MSEITTRTSLDLLYNVSRELTSDLDLHTVLERALSLSSKAIGAERASVIVVDDHQQPVEAAIIVQDRLMPHTVELLRGTLEHGLAGWVFRNRQPALISDSSQDERWQQRPDDAIERSGAKSAMCVPVIARDQVVGVITIVHPTPNFFTQEHLTLLGAISDQAGIAIYNARLHGDLQSTRHRYQELFEDSIDPICITGWNGVVLEANRQAVILSGRLDQSLRGSQMEDLLGLSTHWLFAQEADLQQNRMVQTEAGLHSLSGQTTPVEAYIRRININGENALQWILRDISERKALDSLRETLTESIVHDLRAPLSNIISSLEFFNMYLPAEDSENLREVLSIASRSASRMFRLITSLLDINRLESGQSIIDHKWVEPTPLVYEVIDAVQSNADGKKQVLDIQIEKNLPNMWVDHDMISRVMINLLDNAVKYTPNEGRISLSARSTGDTFEFVVQDSGPGIPAEEKDTVFNKFYRLRSVQKKTGFGLGLAFCKLAVEAHGGRIWVEDPAGNGSCFCFSLPLGPNSPPDE
jgi:two-component system, NtrC family, sensor histidine kinase KinB